MNQRLLIIDDDQSVLEAYRAILDPKGRTQSSRSKDNATSFEVTYVSNAKDALNAIKASVKSDKPFAAAFVDIRLGRGMDGIQTMAEAKELDPSLLFVVVTAFQDDRFDEIASAFGTTFSDRWDFLSKPFSRTEILQKARSLVTSWDRRTREIEYRSQIRVQQEQLLKSERLAAVGTMARGIGHEFGNLLVSMMGHVELALQSKEPKQMENALNVIKKATDRARIIIRNLQTMVKTDSARESVDPNLPIEDALELSQLELQKANIKVIKKASKKLKPISINRIELGQVFLNLFLNAIYAMKEKGKGTLTIETSQNDRHTIFQVSDSGPGVSPSHLERIFEPLFTTKGNEGSGLGLSVSKRIVVTHGGTLEVQSPAQKGAQFTIKIPLKP